MLACATALILGGAVAGVTSDGRMPGEIRSPSSLGEVVFPHRLHYEDLELECVTCHHETDAGPLEIPHPSYFEDFWIDCGACHHPDEGPKLPQSCGACHRSQSGDIADETLSAKVVIHKSCWQCHEAGTGQEASRSCRSCHSGERQES